MSASAWEALAAVEGVEGWLTEAQALRLWRAARDAEGLIVEIGSFRGRSAIVLALASGGPVVCIDPHAGSDRGPREIAAESARGEDDHAVFERNLAAAGVRDQVRHVRAFSDQALGVVGGPVELLYVDGAHRFTPARADIVDWGGRVAPGGRLLVHDAFSSVGVTLALLREVVFARGWRWQGRDGSLAEWSREPARPRDVAVQLASLGWFVRNLLIKALIVVRLRPVARLLGFDSGPWPY